jgi:hypothetical protein
VNREAASRPPEFGRSVRAAYSMQDQVENGRAWAAYDTASAGRNLVFNNRGVAGLGAHVRPTTLEERPWTHGGEPEWAEVHGNPQHSSRVMCSSRAGEARASISVNTAFRRLGPHLGAGRSSVYCVNPKGHGIVTRCRESLKHELASGEPPRSASRCLCPAFRSPRGSWSSERNRPAELAACQTLLGARPYPEGREEKEKRVESGRISGGRGARRDHARSGLK